MCGISFYRVILKKRRSTKSFPVTTANPPASPRLPAKPPTTSHTTSTEVRYASQATRAPMRPMVTKPNKAYVKQAPKVREVEQELYEDMEIGDEGEAIYEETM